MTTGAQDVESTGDNDEPRPLVGYLSSHRLVSARSGPLDDAREEVTTSGKLSAWLTGTGTPLVLPDRKGPSTLLTSGSEALLVDCGNGCVYQMARLGFTQQSLTHVFLTHHHTDHNVDLPFLLMSGWISHREDYKPPRIVGPPGTLEFVNRLLALQEYDIRARLYHGYDTERLAPEVIEIHDGMQITGPTWKATAFRVEHHPVCEAYGYRFDTQENSIVVSGDTKPCDNLVEYAQNVDVLIHEAIYPGYGYPEYHTLSHDVGKVAAKANAQRLVLTHLVPGDLPDERWLDHVRPHYNGPVSVGTDLMQVV